MKGPVKMTTQATITAAGMTGTAFGAYHVKNLVAEISDNEVLGIAAGIAVLLAGSLVVNKLNDSLNQKSTPLVLVSSDDSGFLPEPEEEGVDLLE
jgi:hypothetical protein